MSLKNPVTPPEIDPGTVRLVAQRLNHYATPDPDIILIQNKNIILGRDSVVSTATLCRLDSPKIESWRGRNFSITVQSGFGAHPASFRWVRRLSWG